MKRPPHVDSAEFIMTNRLDKSGKCWVFMGCKNKKGYGLARNGARKTTESVHRMIYKRFVGPIPPHFHVCHHCDNPPCARPDHLFIGTNTDNQHDSIRKGRARKARGEDVSLAKLRETDIPTIRALYRSDRYSQEAISRRFNVNQQSISNVLTGFTWKHVK